MSNIVANPNITAVAKEVNALIGKYRDYLRSVTTDARVIRDDYGDIVALVPRIHCVFKDESDFVVELTTGERANVH
jgi:hypothetical protein